MTRRPGATGLLCVAVLAAAWSSAWGDCNGNGVPDGIDISSGTSLDCNRNGVPDECDTEEHFDAHPIGTPPDPQTLDAADLDGDGDTDVVAASSSNNAFAWYENLDGAGTFSAVHPISNAPFAVSVHAADLDGDGDQDILVAAALADMVAWFVNGDGEGDFSDRVVISLQVDGAWAVSTADVDGDGDLDVLSASQDDNIVAWFENLDGAGSFGPKRVISTIADIAVSVAGADLDGDGDVDVVSASDGDDTIGWYENVDGTGTFGPRQVLSASSNDASAVAVADVDGDGDTDVLSASALDGTIAWFEKVDGVDGFVQHVITIEAEYALSVFAADMDGDSDTDVLSASAIDGEVAWYENLDGQGSFGGARIVAVEPLAVFVLAADVDGDGDSDVLSAAQGEDQIRWHENTGDDCDADQVPDECEPDCNANTIADDCDLTAGTALDCNDNGVPDSCDLAQATSDDCTGNGVPDECEPDCNANSQADSCDILLGPSDDCTANGMPDECEPDCNANSEADSCDILLGPSDDCTSNGVPDECEPDCNADSEADSCELAGGSAADCDGNDVLDECDLVSGAGEDCNRDGLLDACATRVEFEPHPVSGEADFPRSLFAADLDGDLDTDLLSASAFDNTVAWYENLDGSGLFGPQTIVSVAAANPQSVFAADLDGDGRQDVVSASFVDDEIAWYRNIDGAGTFGPQRVIASNANGARSVFAADVDGDSDIDVLSASILDNRISWYENLDSHGKFGPSRLINNDGSQAFAVVAADLDGDGDTDAVSAYFASDHLLWHENQDGHGALWQRHVLSAAADGAWSVAVADADGDGDLDVFAASQHDDTLAWYENLDGAAGFGPERVISTGGNGIVSVAAADLDGDGDADALSASLFDSRVSWHENLDGAGSFGPARTVALPVLGAAVVIAADVDGDGDADVVSAAQESDAIAWHENGSDDCNGNGTPDGCDIDGATSDDCTANGVPDECEADCNDNGVADTCDLESLASPDCNSNGIPDECDPDCNDNGVADACDVATQTSPDCDASGIPDECEADCNDNGVNDLCDVLRGTSEDCDHNVVPDECDPDCNADDVPDACDPDCNSNGVADGCEPDCNANGVADGCDLEAASQDCNGNDVPDECDTGCFQLPACDADGDRCRDSLDSHPFDDTLCSDADGDACEDCLGGVFNPDNDGPDADQDGTCDPADCAVRAAGAWMEPGPAHSMVVIQEGIITRLVWQPPANPGAAIVLYDTLRSPLAADFGDPALCLELDEFDSFTEDTAVPAAGAAFHYLIRVENDCPGPGSLGFDSTGQARSGRSCP